MPAKWKGDVQSGRTRRACDRNDVLNQDPDTDVNLELERLKSVVPTNTMVPSPRNSTLIIVVQDIPSCAFLQRTHLLPVCVDTKPRSRSTRSLSRTIAHSGTRHRRTRKHQPHLFGLSLSIPSFIQIYTAKHVFFRRYLVSG